MTKFVILVKVHLLDAASAIDLYQVHNLPIVNPGTNMSATYDMETDKFTLGKNSLIYILPSEAEYIK